MSEIGNAGGGERLGDTWSDLPLTTEAWLLDIYREAIAGELSPQGHLRTANLLRDQYMAEEEPELFAMASAHYELALLGSTKKPFFEIRVRGNRYNLWLFKHEQVGGIAANDLVAELNEIDALARRTATVRDRKLRGYTLAWAQRNIDALSSPETVRLQIQDTVEQRVPYLRLASTAIEATGAPDPAPEPGAA